MRQVALAFVVSILPAVAMSDAPTPATRDIIHNHVLPRFEALAASSQSLSDAAQTDCTPTSPPLRAAYNAAFDTWISASHLRFGPTEQDDRAFALAFWPDGRGATARALTTLIKEEDPIARSPEEYTQMSIAARGFFALEFLLYDRELMEAGDAGYHCDLVRTISVDIATTSAAILDDWESDYARVMLTPDPDGLYRSDEEVLQEFFKALGTGLQFTSETRIGRPLGTFDRPHPLRAEARRSARSARHVALSLSATRDMAKRLSGKDPDLANTLDRQFDHALTQLNTLNDPVFAGVADPQSRLKIEVLQQSVDAIRSTVRDNLGPTLGVAAGFNSLDGD